MRVTRRERCLMCGRFYAEVLPDQGCCQPSCWYDFNLLPDSEQLERRLVAIYRTSGSMRR